MGIEPTNEGFADLSLPTWVPRLWDEQYSETPAPAQMEDERAKSANPGARRKRLAGAASLPRAFALQ